MRFCAKLLLLLLLVSSAAYADTLSGTLLDSNGNRIAGARVTVCSTSSTGNAPCAPALQTTFTAGDGTWFVTIVSGTYDISFDRAGLTASKLTNVNTAATPVNAFNIITVAKLNGVISVDGVTYTTIQAAINALPASGGTIFVPHGTTFDSSGLTITNPVDLKFDSGVFAYGGTTNPAITCTSSRGVVIEGAGRRGDDTSTSGTTISVTGTAVNGITTSCPGISVRDFNLIGPGSGSGKGIVNTANRFMYERLNISSWGSDGWTNDGTSSNANVGTVLKVRSSANGGNGFTVKGTNGQLVTFINTDGSANTGDGYNISNQLNMFLGTNADSDTTGIGYHFASGGSQNTGSLDPDTGAKLQFDSGANNNLFFSVAASSQVTNNGTGNLIWAGGSSTFLGSLSLNSDTGFSANPQMTFNGFTATPTAIGSFAIFTPTKAITITRLQISQNSNNTGFSGCATFPVESVFDNNTSSAIASVTVGTLNTADSGALSVAVPAGHVLFLRTTTAGSGCATTGTNMNVTMVYTMQ